jgi:hypothetical protein
MSGRVTDIVVEAPLRGEWTALHTPAHRVPSHGTNHLGQRYAFDFIQVGGSELQEPDEREQVQALVQYSVERRLNRTEE